jgi:lysophospholipase L1-like esterase
MGQPTRLVILGDSVTVGQGFSGVTDSTSYVALLRQELSRGGAAVEVVPSALEGIDTGYAVKRFARMVTALEPDAVLIALGLNDVLPPGGRAAVTPAEYQQNLLGLVDRILSIDARPILATPNPRYSLEANGPDAGWLAPYVAKALDVAEYHQLLCLNLYERFLDQGRLRELIPDGIHPNPEGHRLMAHWLAEPLCACFGGRYQPAEQVPLSLPS